MELVSKDLVTQDEDIDEKDVFSVDLDGFEGPLHLLLDLGRRQKVDLLHVSILELATQYLAFIEDTRRKRIDLAADYLLMAAWLAYLKSRLLLPREQSNGEEDSEDGDAMAKRLAFRLKRLDAMREAGAQLVEGNLLGRDVFVRGAPEQPTVVRKTEYDTTIWHLTQAFGAIRQRKEQEAPHVVEKQFVLPLEHARDELRNMRSLLTEWANLDDIRSKIMNGGDVPARSVTASVFSAALELTRDGEVDVRQEAHFGPLYLRGKNDNNEGATA